MKTIYLKRGLSEQGRESLISEELFDFFKASSSEILLGYKIVENNTFEKQANKQTQRDLIPLKYVSDFDPDIIYFEGGLIGRNATPKIPKEFALELIKNGKVLIIADANSSQLRRYKKEYSDNFELIRATPNYGKFDDSDPIYLSDPYNGGGIQISCYPEKMIIDEWLRPIYDGVEKIIVSWAVELKSIESSVISGNKDETGTMHNDIWIDKSGYCFFGSVAQIGNGFIVFIAGSVSYYSRENKDNAKWLLNLSEFLLQEANKNKERTTSHYYSNNLLFLSHRSMDKPIVEKVAFQLKKSGNGIWLDKERLLPSDSLIQKINEGLTEMTHFVLFWSKSCSDSPWVERELSSGITQLIEQKKPIFIVRLDDTPVPSIISDLFRIEAKNMTTEAIGDLINDTIDRLKKRI